MTRDCLRKHCEAMCKKFENDPTSGTYQEHKLILDLLNQTEWIPVSERLPEINEEAIVTDVEVNDSYASQYLGKGYWDCDNGPFNNRIIAWMPKPKPYKAESEEV